MPLRAHIDFRLSVKDVVDQRLLVHGMLQGHPDVPVGEDRRLRVVAVHDVPFTARGWGVDQIDNALVLQIQESGQVGGAQAPGDIHFTDFQSGQQGFRAGIDDNEDLVQAGSALPIIVKRLVFDEFTSFPVHDPKGTETDRLAHGQRLVQSG